LRHTLGVKMLFKIPPAFFSVDVSNSPYCSHRALEIGHEKAGDPLFYDLRNGTPWVCNHGRAASHGLNHHKAKGFAPIDGKQKSSSLTEKCIFLATPDFPDEVNKRVIKQRLDDILKIYHVNAINLGRYLQWHTGAFRDLDSVVQALFWRGTSEKYEVAAASVANRKRLSRQTVVDGTLPIRPRQRPTLSV
jgi:hypothetical protein